MKKKKSERITITAHVDKRHKVFVTKQAEKRRTTESFIVREILDKVIDNMTNK